MTKLEFKGLKEFNDDPIEALSLSKLKELRIEQNYLNQQQLTSILCQATSLEHIYFCHNTGLEQCLSGLERDSLPSMKKFEFSSCNLPFDSFVKILQAADNLEEVDGHRAKGLVQGGMPIPEFKHLGLKKLKLDESQLDDQALITMVRSCSQLQELNVEKCKNITGNLSELRPNDLEHLKKLKFGRKISHPDAINNLLNAAPNLKELSIYKMPLDGHALSFGINPHLTRLWVDKVSISPENIERLVNHAPNLEELYLMDFKYDDDTPLHFRTLNSLKELWIGKNHFLDPLINVVPNVEHLKISFLRDWQQTPITVSPNFLPKLKKVDFGCCDISAEQLCAIVNAAPNMVKFKNSLNRSFGESPLTLMSHALQEVETFKLGAKDAHFSQAQAILEHAPKLKKLLLDHQSKIADAELTYLRNTYPEVEIEKISIRWRMIEPVILEGNVTWTKKQEKYAQEKFIGHQQNPPPDKYILEMHAWQKGKLEPVKAKPRQKVKPVTYSSFQNLMLTYEHAPGFADDSIHYGQFSLKGSYYSDERYLIPCFSTQDEILAIVENDKIEIYLDEASGLYYFKKVKELKDTDVLHYVIKKNPPNLKISKPTYNYTSTIQGLRFTESGGLMRSHAVMTLMGLTIPERIAALAYFCFFPNVHDVRKINAKNQADLLNQLIVRRAGPDQHRASLFTALATELGIDAHLVKNEVSYFVTVRFNGQSTNIDLGGHHYVLKAVPLNISTYDEQVPQIFLNPKADNQAHPQTYQLELDSKPQEPASYQVRKFSRPSLVYDEVLESTADDVYYGQVDLSEVTLGEWWQIPALTHQDELLSISVDSIDYEISKDNETGYYYLKLNKLPAHPVLHFAIKANKDLMIAVEQISEIDYDVMNTEISKLRFSTPTRLTNPNAILLLARRFSAAIPLRFSEKDLIESIVYYCRFPKANILPTKGLSETEVLNRLLQTRQGDASQRLQLAKALLEAFNLDSQIIKNAINAYLVINISISNQRAIYDLGANLPPLEIKPISELPRVDNDTNDVMLDCDNRFQTWNSHPLSSKTVKDVLQEITVLDSQQRRLIKITNDKDATMLSELAAFDKSMYVTTSLAELSLTALHIENGTYQSVPSTIAQLLRAAANNPDQTFHWIINWSDVGINDTPYNSIIDDIDRNLFGMPIPENVHIIVLSNEQTLDNKKDDFYSRFDALSIYPQLKESHTSLTKTKADIAEYDAVLSPNQDWQSELFGQYRMENQQFYVTTGKLAQAVANGIYELTIHNPPLYDDEFVFAYKELVNHQRYYFNGEWHQLPESFKIHLGEPNYKTPSVAVADVHRSETILLNTASMPHFFEKQVIQADGSIALDKGFFAKYPAINLIVGKPLADADWYKLVEEAAKHGCAVSIQHLPNVIVPSRFKAWNQGMIDPVKANHIDFVVTNDVDKTLQDMNTNCVITVKPTTQITNLFFKYEPGSLSFDVSNKDLLKALEQGQDIVFKGQFSPRFLQQLQSLLMTEPYLLINGQKIDASSKITVISDSEAKLHGFKYRVEEYKPELWLSKLPKSVRERLKACYQKLDIKPTYSHFMGLPSDTLYLDAWADELIKQLALSQGHVTNLVEPTTIDDIAQALEHRPFVFLISGTGEGKSYFVTKTLKEYFNKKNTPMQLFQGIKSLVAWLESDNQPSFLFIDEANLTDENYEVLDRIARGEQDIWVNGMRYPVKPGHRIIFAGNPPQYQGRNNPELFKRFPYYIQFAGQPLSKILTPILVQFNEPDAVLELVMQYIEKTKQAGVIITPRNAQSMLIKTRILKDSPDFKDMSETCLLRVAIARELKSMFVEKNEIKEIFDSLKYYNETPTEHVRKKRKTMSPYTAWKDIKKHDLVRLKEELSTEDHDYVWTNSRLKVAQRLDDFFSGLQLKKDNLVKQESGISGLVLEGVPGVGKSRLLVSYLIARNIDYMVVTPSRPQEMRNKLRLAAERGCPVLIDEFNSNVDEV